jgi:phosphatidylinositol glycan class K
MSLNFLRRLVLLCVFSIIPASSASSSSSTISTASHTSNHAVILSSSRYWFNYRHATNAVSIYQLLKDHGNIPDDNIVLMVADDFATNDRNVFKNQLLTHGRHGKPSLYSAQTQMDYRGDDVTIDNFRRVLLGRPSESSLPVLQSNAQSNLLIYMTGHGGNEFFKFQDHQEITARQLARTLKQLHALGKYQELLLVVDTCQAFSMAAHIIRESVPNVTVVASSLHEESSYADRSDGDLGVAVTERYTGAMVQHLRNFGLEGTLQESLVDPYSYHYQQAHIGSTDATATRKLNESKVRDFFAHVVRSTTTTTTEALVTVVRDQLPRFQAPYMEQTPRNDDDDEERQGRNAQVCDATTTTEEVDDRAPWLWFPGMEPTDSAFWTWTAILLGTIVAWASRRY